jgi:hypothetical protein
MKNQVNRQDAKFAKGSFTAKSIGSTENIYFLKFLIRTWRTWRLGGENEVCL